MTEAPDIGGLREFSALDDRDLSPFFAGRSEELEKLASRCQDVLKIWRERGRVGGRAMAVVGCPGMGKTSLLDRFESLCNDADDPASSAGEAGEAVERMFEHFRVGGSAGDLDRWKRAIAEDSQGFPQHLHVGMKAAAEALAASGGEATPEGLATASAAAEIARQAYYRGRIRPEFDDRRRAIAGLVGDVARNEPLPPEALYERARRYLADAAGAEETPPTKEIAKRFVEDLIHDGVIQRKYEWYGSQARPGREVPILSLGYEVPIPSMAAWILGEYARCFGPEPEAGSGPSM